MFRTNKKNLNAILNARSSNLDRFKITVDKLHGPYFLLSLDELVKEEDFLAAKMASMAADKAANIHVDATRFLSDSLNLAEVQFCLGLFALAYSVNEAAEKELGKGADPNSVFTFDVNDDTSASDIFDQLDSTTKMVPQHVREKFPKVKFDPAVALDKAIKGISAANRALYNAGVTASRVTRKNGKKVAGVLGKWFTKISQ